MAQHLNVTSVPWIDSGDAPPLALDRDKRDIISQGVADPLSTTTSFRSPTPTPGGRRSSTALTRRTSAGSSP